MDLETRLAFQFLVICSVEFKYSFVFLTNMSGKPFSFFKQKSINKAVVTEQLSSMLPFEVIVPVKMVECFK